MSLEELYAHLLTHEMWIEHSTASANATFPYANVATKPSQKPHYNNNTRPTKTGSNSSSQRPSFNNRAYGNQGKGFGRGGYPAFSGNNNNNRPVCQV